MNHRGRKRVIITNVSPQVENGKYPAKTAIEDETILSADIFADGHDELAAAAYVRYAKGGQWEQLPMQHVLNDRWEAVLIPQKTGFYEFQVKAWIDHFSTWQKGLRKKFDAKQNVEVELKIGAELLDSVKSQATASDRALLEQWSEKLSNPGSIESSVLLALSDEVMRVMKRYHDESLVTVDEHIYTIEAERKKAIFSSWYELFPRSAAAEPGKHGSFKDVKKLLPRVARMGFDTLYFPPIHPIGEKNRKGKNNSLTAGPGDPGSPWAIGSRLGGHKDIHPELGSLNDFKDLLQEAKKYDIEIALDIAYQCAPDHPYVEKHPQWFKWRPDGTVQYAENPPKKYEDILPFNFETEDWKNLWEELKSVIDFWIANGVTVFRIDNPHTKAFAFWEWMIAEVRKEHPEVIFLAEAFTRPRVMERLAKAGFNQSYTYYTWRNTKAEIEEYMTELTKSSLRYYFRPNFWPNTPDILPPALTYGGENAHIMRMILAATLSSNYGLYGPVYEFGINTPHPGKEEYTDNEKYELKTWNWNQYSRIGEIITRVNKIRKQNPALQTTWNIDFAETTSDQIICFTKTDKKSGNRLIIAANLDPYNTHGAHVKLPLEKLGLKPGEQYIVRDLLSGDKYRWQDEWNYVQLNPYEMPAHVLRVEQL